MTIVKEADRATRVTPKLAGYSGNKPLNESILSFQFLEEPDCLLNLPEKSLPEICSSLTRLLGEIAPSLPPEATQSENLQYLRAVVGPRIDSIERFSDLPYKVQMYCQLVKAGLMDPETRCYPWDLPSIFQRIAYLLKQGRTDIWISTAIVDDVAYAGIPFTEEKMPAFSPQIPEPLRIIYKNLDVLLEKNPELLKKFPFPKRRAPLFKNIKTIGDFYRVLPDLLVLYSQQPSAFCKVFPQDYPELSIASAIIDLYPYLAAGDLGPSIMLEMTRGTHTRRGEKLADIQAQLVTYPFPAVIGDRESALISTQILSQPIRDGQPFPPKVIELLRNLSCLGINLEFMVNQENNQIAFCTDVIPISIQEPPPIRGDILQLESLIKSLSGAKFIDTHKFPDALNELRAFQTAITEAREKEQGRPCVTVVSREFMIGKKKSIDAPVYAERYIPSPQRPDWREITRLSEGYGDKGYRNSSIYKESPFVSRLAAKRKKNIT